MSLLFSNTMEKPAKTRSLESTIQLIIHQKQTCSQDDNDDQITGDNTASSSETSNNSSDYMPQSIDNDHDMKIEIEILSPESNGDEIVADAADSGYGMPQGVLKMENDEELEKKSKSMDLIEAELNANVNVSLKQSSPKKDIARHLKVSLRTSKKKIRRKKQVKSTKSVKETSPYSLVEDNDKPSTEGICNIPLDNVNISTTLELEKSFLVENANKNMKNMEHNCKRKQNPEHEDDVNVPQVGACKKAKFHCEICVRDFAKKSLYEKHTRVHTGLRPYTCEFCQKTFKYKHNLTVHAKMHSGMKYNCAICGKPFPDGCTLRKHELIHVTDHPFVCDMCGRSFSHQFKLTAHQRGHTGETPFACTLCDKAYKEKGTLVKHMRKHTGETFYDCSECDKKFSQRCHYTAHMRIHSGDLPFECEFCHRRFREHGQLKRHVKVHYGDRPFRCTVCSRGFECLKELTMHMKNNSGQGGHVVLLDQADLGTPVDDNMERLLYEINEVPVGTKENIENDSHSKTDFALDQTVTAEKSSEAYDADNKPSVHDNSVGIPGNICDERNVCDMVENMDGHDDDDNTVDEGEDDADSEAINDKATHAGTADTSMTSGFVDENSEGKYYESSLQVNSEETIEEDTAVDLDENGENDDDHPDKNVEISNLSFMGNNSLINVHYDYVL